MAMVNFKKGLLANLPAAKTEGTFYVTTDERALYLDIDGSTRVRIGDFQEFATPGGSPGKHQPQHHRSVLCDRAERAGEVERNCLCPD